LNRKADHKENEDDRNGPDSPGRRPGESLSSQSNQNTVGIPEASRTSAAASPVDALNLNRLGVELTDKEQPNKVAADTDADHWQRRSSFRIVDRPSCPTGSSTSLTIVVPPRRPLKRPLSPERSSTMIDLSSVRHLCIDGKIYEVIDLMDDEVRFHSGIVSCAHLALKLNR
jgi:hypothetical protein